MINLEQENDHLAQVDQHIAEGDLRVTEQIALIERMTKDGQDTASATELLRALKEMLEQWRWHRHLILDRIAQLTAEP
ncbi:hypothetical protein F6X53_05285 [Methylobacterium soli]|uniref:Uncharacterized protein n=2 Tax=Methylobacterium soli TaxID=553447 RepID=A0A6L3T253_9HYPH|nr:hypothetical protein F6X53_05285 [Methylobacterium soli]GJE42464.1 hypothetical protein AEGHOMDF_1636 [Methylobacterium soli]